MHFEDYPEWMKENVKRAADTMGFTLVDYCKTFHLLMPTGTHNDGELPINLKGGLT